MCMMGVPYHGLLLSVLIGRQDFLQSARLHKSSIDPYLNAFYTCQYFLLQGEH